MLEAAVAVARAGCAVFAGKGARRPAYVDTVDWRIIQQGNEALDTLQWIESFIVLRLFTAGL